MIFLQSDKPAIQWATKNKKPMFQFVHKRLETDDSALIKLLTDLGYEMEPPESKELRAARAAGMAKTIDGNIHSPTVKEL